MFYDGEKFGFTLSGFFQWKELFNFRKYNWANFDLIHIGVETGSYKGLYFEITFILLGIGFWAEVFDRKTRQGFADEMRGIMEEEGIDIPL